MKIGVVGSGIGSIASAYYLKLLKHEVHLFEANSYLGGHTHTHEINVEEKTFPVDTGFLVHNDRTYPNLIEFFDRLNIETHESEMTFSVSKIDQGIEWSGTNLSTLFSQRKNIFNPKFLIMIKDILRFNKNSETYYEIVKRDVKITLKDLLREYKYSQYFIDWYLLPMGGCIWSTPTEDMLKFPAATFLRFCLNHGLLQITNRPQWKTVLGGCNTYTNKVAKLLDKVYLNSPVVSLVSSPSSVKLKTNNEEFEFDRVFVGSHPPQTLAMLSNQDVHLKDVLKNFKYQPNKVVLHTDQSILPKSKKAWSAWNYSSIRGDDGRDAISVSYLLNILQPLPVKTPVIVTLNPKLEIDPKKIIKEMNYEHPLFDSAAIENQAKIDGLQGQENLYFAGAWMRYGFHEDGIWGAKNAIEVFKRLEGIN